MSFVFVTGSDGRPQLNRVGHTAGLLLSGNLFFLLVSPPTLFSFLSILRVFRVFSLRDLINTSGSTEI